MICIISRRIVFLRNATDVQSRRNRSVSSPLSAVKIFIYCIQLVSKPICQAWPPSQFPTIDDKLYQCLNSMFLQSLSLSPYCNSKYIYFHVDKYPRRRLHPCERGLRTIDRHFRYTFVLTFVWRRNSFNALLFTLVVG